MMMNGRDTLDVFDFGVLFQALAQSRKVGTLQVTAGRREKFIYLDRGRVEAIYTPRSRFRLGRILFNQRALEMDELRPVLEDQRSEEVTDSLGEMLCARGLVTEEQLRDAVRYQMVEELLEIFYWKNVSYSFFGGPAEKALRHISRRLTRVGGSHDANDLLLHVTKIIDDIDKFNQVTPSLKDVYELTEDPEEYVERSGLPDFVRDFLLLIDGKRDMREILREMRLNRFDVMDLFYRFRTDGLIRAKNGFELLMLAENQRKEFSPAKMARLYERVRELGVEGFEIFYRMAQVYEELGDLDRAAAHYLDYAKKSLREKNLDAAEIGATRAVELFPDSRSLRQLKVTIFEQKGRLEDMADELGALARLHIESGEFEEAEAALERALEIRPKDEDLALARVDALSSLGKTRQAGSVCLALARARQASRDLFGAEEAYRLAVKTCPESLLFRNALMKHLVARREGSRAVGEFREFIEIALRLTEDRPERGVRLLDAIHSRLVALGGQNSTAMAALADAYLSRDATDAALDVLAEAGEAQVCARRLTDALDTFQRAIEIAPDRADIRERIASLHADMGDSEKALSQYRRVATQHLKRGDTDQAEHAYREMLRVNPFSPEALKELAHLTGKQGKKSEAARRLSQIGILHQTAGRVEEAIQFFDEACSTDPGNPTYVRMLAEALGEVLQMERSLESYGELLKLCRSRGEHAGAIDAAVRILALDGSRTAVVRALEDSYRALGEVVETTVEKVSGGGA